jgi:hypothetical protein
MPALASDRETMLRISALSSATTTRTGEVVDMTGGLDSDVGGAGRSGGQRQFGV